MLNHSLITIEQRFCYRRDMTGHDAIRLQQVVVRRGLPLDVAQTEAAHLRRSLLAEDFRHGAAGSIDDGAVRGGDDVAGPLRERSEDTHGYQI